jgi:outer membrane protein OmpA-like peptidoglycan-associated protein
MALNGHVQRPSNATYCALTRKQRNCTVRAIETKDKTSLFDRFFAGRHAIGALLLAAAPCLGHASGTPVPQDGYSDPAPVGTINIKTLPETIGLEHQDRIRRFSRLAEKLGIQAPTVDDIPVPVGEVPGVDYPIPVVRLRFKERVFFDFDKDAVRPSAADVLDLIAENMKRDLPDASLTIVGHTDAIGTDAYNYDLSLRRARGVMQLLSERGVRLIQMSTVAVGKSQPEAPNSTEEGRAQNRRVEFLISAYERANLLIVARRRIICDYLRLRDTGPVGDCTIAAPPSPQELAVQKPVATKTPAGVGMMLASVENIQVQKPISELELKKIAPEPLVIATPAEVKQAQLRREFNW